MLTTKSTLKHKFTDLNELFKYCEDEHHNVKYVGYQGDQLFFEDDNTLKSYGGTLPEDGCEFTESGLKALFTKMGVSGLYPTMSASTDRGCASNYLNRLLAQPEIKANLTNQQFIIDTSNLQNPIIGMVSKQYNKYSNHQFLKGFLDINATDNLNFERAMVDNTLLTVNWLDHEYTGIMIDGKKDRSKLGLYSRNSMVGNSPLRLDASVFDTLCTNGMMIERNIAASRLVHRGYDSMSYQLSDMTRNAKEGFELVRKQLEYTLAIPFNENSIEKMLLADAPLDIIKRPSDTRFYSSKRKFKEQSDKIRNLNDTLSFVMKIPQTFGGEHTHKVINSSYRNGNTSLYHFIGAFTEYAQEQNPVEQYRIEKEAGNLVNWIGTHDKVFDTVYN